MMIDPFRGRPAGGGAPDAFALYHSAAGGAPAVVPVAAAIPEGRAAGANHLWFAWAAFNAESPVYAGNSG